MDDEEWAAEEEAIAQNKAGKGFTQHLSAIRRVLERARIANRKFNLSKCFLSQWEVVSLGLVVGCGCVRADPAKSNAIAVWPRASRKEDAERFLATMVFLRDHFSLLYSEIAKPLRDILSELHKETKEGNKKGKANAALYSDSERMLDELIDLRQGGQARLADAIRKGIRAQVQTDHGDAFYDVIGDSRIA